MAWTEFLSAMFASASKENRRQAANSTGRTPALKGSTEQHGADWSEVLDLGGVGVGDLKVDMIKIQFTCMKLSVYLCCMCVVMWFLAGSLHNYVSITFKDVLGDHSQGSHLSVWKMKHIFHLFCMAGHAGKTHIGTGPYFSPAELKSVWKRRLNLVEEVL